MRLHTTISEIRALDELATGRARSVTISRDTLARLMMDHHGLVSAARDARIELAERIEGAGHDA